VSRDLRSPRPSLLIADDDDALRRALALVAQRAVPGIAVIEASDGAEAIQRGLQDRPDMALLDVDMPRLGGLDAAITLIELVPGLALAVQTGAAASAKELAPLLVVFDKMDLVGIERWLRREARGRMRHAA
jgi:CheY-like chemotaxis protein